MTLSDPETITRPAMVRMVFSDEGKYTVHAIAELFTDIGHLFTLSIVDKMDDALKPRPPIEYHFEKDIESVISRTDFQVRAHLEVLYLSKASPLEVILAVPTILGAAHGVLALHRRYQESRIDKARTDLEVELLEGLLQRLRAKDYDVDNPYDAGAHKLVEGASRAMTAASTIEILEP